MLLRYFGFLVFCVAVGNAQINTGRITGAVTDASGSTVPHVVIRVVNEETGVVSTTASPAVGEYLVNFLVPGHYRVEAEGTGFQKAVQTGVVVNAGGIARLDIQL